MQKELSMQYAALHICKYFIYVSIKQSLEISGDQTNAWRVTERIGKQTIKFL